MNDIYVPRFAFEITEEQQKRVNALMGGYGLRKAIFSKILDEVLDIIEAHGGMAIGILMSDVVPLKEVIPTMKEVSSYKRVKSF